MSVSKYIYLRALFFMVLNGSRRDLMGVTPDQTAKILAGGISFSQLGFSMLITRLKSVYTKNPTSATLDKCTEEINAFLQKYAPIITADYAKISDL